MFEDSVFASGRQVRAGRTKWAVVGAAGVQAAGLAVMMMVPLLRPEILPVVFAAPKVERVMLKKPAPPKVEVRPAEVRTAAGVSLASTAAAPMRESVMGRGLGVPRPGVETDGPRDLALGRGMAFGSGLPAGINETGPGIVVRAAAGPVKTMRVSSGIVAGLLIVPIRPVYPAIAKAAHVEGTVVVMATIDRSGRIVGLRVQSGPAMLQRAAVDAVKDARYRPYLLNGVATEVETTISVNFRLGE